MESDHQQTTVIIHVLITSTTVHATSTGVALVFFTRVMALDHRIIITATTTTAHITRTMALATNIKLTSVARDHVSPA